MNKQIMKRWVKALRSGKYKQGKNWLNAGNKKFCCLGVLCEILKDELELRKEIIVDDYYSYGYDHEMDCVGLFYGVKKYAGMASAYGHIPSLKTTLANLNDGGEETKPHTFKQIADIIEKHYKEL